MRLRIVAAVIGGVVVGMMADVTTVQAIPAFSRQHKAECTTCHTIYPELNEYGEAFLKNGFVYSHAKLQKGKPAAAAILGGGGNPAVLEKLKGQAAAESSDEGTEAGGYGKKNEGLWLAAIPETLPLSVTATLNAAYVNNPRDNNELDLSTRALALQAGGNFRDMVGFFAKYTLYSEGIYDPEHGINPNVPQNNKSELTELYLTWRHALGTPVNLKIGRMRPKMSLWKSTNKVSVSSFAPHVYTVGSSPFYIDAPEDALEANAVLGKRAFVAAGIVDRGGQNENEGYGHLSYKFGGADFLGNEPQIDLESDSIWDYLSITVATFGYSGRNARLVGGVAEYFNDYYRVGAELDLLYQKFRLRASGVKGRDTNPDYLADKKTINSVAVAAEAEYLFDSNLIGAFRYEYVYDQLHLTERHSYIPYLAFAPLQNIRIVLEYKYDDYLEQDDEKVANLGISFSF